MQIKTAHGVFPDYLSCTFNPDNFPYPDVRQLILDTDFSPEKSHKENAKVFRSPDGIGIIRIAYGSRWTGISFTGAACNHICGIGAVGNLLQVLCTEHHRVTRLDLAKDINTDSLEFVQAELDRVWSRGKTGRVRLGRKAVTPVKVSRVEGVRRDGACTGTVYIGDRKDRYYAKVYDKRAEVYARRDLDIFTERLRYEVSACKGTASLRDFLEPDPLFYYLASPDLLTKPADVADWSYAPMDPLNLPPLAQLTEHEKMIRLIESSPDLATLAMLIEAKPSELPLVMRRLEARLTTRGEARAA